MILADHVRLKHFIFVRFSSPRSSSLVENFSYQFTGAGQTHVANTFCRLSHLSSPLYQSIQKRQTRQEVKVAKRNGEGFVTIWARDLNDPLVQTRSVRTQRQDSNNMNQSLVSNRFTPEANALGNENAFPEICKMSFAHSFFSGFLT